MITYRLQRKELEIYLLFFRWAYSNVLLALLSFGPISPASGCTLRRSAFFAFQLASWMLSAGRRGADTWLYLTQAMTYRPMPPGWRQGEERRSVATAVKICPMMVHCSPCAVRARTSPVRRVGRLPLDTSHQLARNRGAVST